MFRNIIEVLSEIEIQTGVKCIHNEINILSLLLDRGQVPSLEIFAQSRRSLAGHNADLRRLSSIGLIRSSNGIADKRERLYELSAEGREMLLEHELLMNQALRASIGTRK